MPCTACHYPPCRSLRGPVPWLAIRPAPIQSARDPLHCHALGSSAVHAHPRGILSIAFQCIAGHCVAIRSYPGLSPRGPFLCCAMPCFPVRRFPIPEGSRPVRSLPLTPDAILYHPIHCLRDPVQCFALPSVPVLSARDPVQCSALPCAAFPAAPWRSTRGPLRCYPFLCFALLILCLPRGILSSPVRCYALPFIPLPS